MRIISGEYGGRRLQAVPGMKTRPTLDKVKETMFNILRPYLKGGNVLDLYAGTGALGIEAVSRGMDHATLVDRQYAAYQTIQKNIAVTKQPEKFTLLKMDAKKALHHFADEQEQFDLILLDPPYKKQQIEKLLQRFVELQLLKPDAVILAETDTTVSYPELTDYRILKQQTYGITEVAIFQYQGGQQA
ncbi:hypothetical protein IV38_GL000279 [Lactobacillus selangorensis]|uniref:Methyltransferase n=1 Tax=Lactobacillus selangorensis TaxID=81857 RepID=A0A0R2FLC1_9LACO|nr:16S rRNA (guanine(966)-N(2))-methyltransferase RsmD [Lactobacillus selangorensis]KRN29395.1 hypothetical protein IV38_GL000279 [Lactobacillus selangorensis]KRN34076.1 hypothetical protein IV40_GL000390 [Lactobacillus selangorensis]